VLVDEPRPLSILPAHTRRQVTIACVPGSGRKEQEDGRSEEEFAVES